MIHLLEDDLTLLHYGELPPREERAARAHLVECADCRRRNDEVVRLFAMVDASAVPEPDAAYEADVWRRLQPSLRAERERSAGGFTTWLRGLMAPVRGPAWAAAGGLAAVILLAFFLGRFWPAQDRVEPAAPSTAEAQPGGSLRERILLTALQDHFDRSQMMIVDLASADAAPTVDISTEQRRAADLLSATRLYRLAAVDAGDPGVADVLEALERVLTEVMVSPPTLTAYELEALQRRIDEQELLFKLRVAGSSARQRGTDTRQGPRT